MRIFPFLPNFPLLLLNTKEGSRVESNLQECPSLFPGNPFLFIALSLNAAFWPLSTQPSYKVPNASSLPSATSVLHSDPSGLTEGLFLRWLPNESGLELFPPPRNCFLYAGRPLIAHSTSPFLSFEKRFRVIDSPRMGLGEFF